MRFAYCIRLGISFFFAAACAFAFWLLPCLCICRDAFAFAETFGQDRITDFDAGVDVLRLFASSGEARTFKAFKRASEDTPEGVLYDRGGDGENTILLQDVSLADLTKADLDFV